MAMINKYLSITKLNRIIIITLQLIFACFAKNSCPAITWKISVFEKFTMQAVRFQVGPPENLYITNDELIPEPGDREVRIKVMATAINRADTLQRKGMYNPPPGTSDILGLEAAGCIDKLGPNCPASLAGQNVMALLPGGGNAGYVVCRYEHVMIVPPNLDLTMAAAVPEVWLTAYQLLHFIGNIRKEDTVLIHAGGSGVGTAAVQLVKQAGAKSIITAGTSQKIQLAESLGASAGINYKEENVAERVMEITKGKGVNLILDCVGASMFEHNIKVIALEGRWVLYGLMGGAQTNVDLRQILGKRVTLTASTLRSRSIEYKEKLVKAFSSLLYLFENGTFKPIIDQVLPLIDIQKAHTRMENNENKGKIILKIETD